MLYLFTYVFIYSIIHLLIHLFLPQQIMQPIDTFENVFLGIEADNSEMFPKILCPKTLSLSVTKFILGKPDHLTCFLRNTYVGQEATVRIRHATTDWFNIGSGVCQGCILSASLLNLYVEGIIAKCQARCITNWNQVCQGKYQ